jgi:hypothetical protein
LNIWITGVLKSRWLCAALPVVLRWSFRKLVEKGYLDLIDPGSFMNGLSLFIVQIRRHRKMIIVCVSVVVFQMVLMMVLISSVIVLIRIGVALTGV